MALLRVEMERGETGVALALKGELDISSVGRVEDQLAAIGQPGPELVVMDLRELEFMDSTGLRLIVRSDEQARSRGGRLVIVRGPEPVQRVFEIVGLDTRLEMVDEPPSLNSA
jgi:anti-anti-sigma factor